MASYEDSGDTRRFGAVAITSAALAAGFAAVLLWAGLTWERPGIDVALPPEEATAEPVRPESEQAAPQRPDQAAEVAEAPVPADTPTAAAPPPPAVAEATPAAPSMAAVAPASEAAGPPREAQPPAERVEPRAEPSPAGAPEAAFAAQRPGGGSPRAGVLLPAPLPGLAEETPVGLLPIIATDGRQPWRVYGRPFQSTGQPRIAVVLVDLGLSSAASNRAIQLDGAVTLAFAPHARDLQSWIELARTAGHEVLLQLPMEPQDYPADDPGPQVLLTSLTPTENIERLNWHLARFAGYVGVVDFMGERFARAPQHLEPILRVLKNRGLLLFDSGRPHQSRLSEVGRRLGVVTVTNDVTLDTVAARPDIAARLSELEALARERGSAVATGHLFPVTIELLEDWIEGLPGKGITLAPLSAVAATP